MPPKGNLEMPVVVVAEDGAAPHPPGMALASKAGSGATDDTASAQLGGTDKVPSEAAWPTLADAPEPRPASGPTLPKPLTAPPSAPVIEPRPSKSRLRPYPSKPSPPRRHPGPHHRRPGRQSRSQSRTRRGPGWPNFRLGRM